MALQIVHPQNCQRIWVPVEPGETIYTGALVGVDIATPLEGVRPVPVAAGANNTTNKDIPLGICIGNNNISANVVYSSTYKAEYITQGAAGSHYGSTKMFQGVEGPYAKGDPQAYVLVSLIDPTTIIRAPIYNNTSTYGTAPTVSTVSTASGGDGIGCTVSAATVATVANFGTIYVRTGANRGIYRTLTSSSATVLTWLKAMPAEFAIGDQVVVINGLRPYGPSYAYFDAEGMSISCNVALTADYFIIHVVRLDLSEAGNEYVEFRFDADNFCAKRA